MTPSQRHRSVERDGRSDTVSTPSTYTFIGAIRGPTLTSLAIVWLATTTACQSATDVGQPGTGPLTSAAPRLSVVLEPNAISVSPGGSTQSIGTIRGATGSVLSAVLGAPGNVSVRVTSVATTDSVVTKKYIVFANAGAVPGRYVLTVRVTASGESDVESPLTLTVTTP